MHESRRPGCRRPSGTGVRACAAIVGLLAAGLLAACADSDPGSPLPVTPDPNRQVSLAPSSYLLRADQMTGYNRSDSQTLSSGSLGDEAGDPSLKPTLDAQGMQYGARYTYQEPGNVDTLPFLRVITEAIVFNDSTGAAYFFNDEAVRHDVAPSGGGTVTTVKDLPATGMDAVLGFSATAPAQATTTTPPQTWLAVARRGRVVIELLGSGLAAQATRTSFDALLSRQEALLAASPSS